MTENDTIRPPEVAASDEPVPDQGIGAAIRALIEDAQTLVEAEIAYRKEQASYGLGEAKSIIVMLLLGLAFGFFTLLAIVVGLLLALAHYVGVWGALAIVGGALALLAVLCLMRAVRKISAAKAALTGGGGA